jgi:hypothetical protein
MANSMEHWAPVIQTLLWVGLIGFAGWKYQPHIDRLLTALQKRIDSGGAVKIGPVSLDEIKTQSEETQRADVQAAVLAAGPPAEDAHISQEAPSTPKTDILQRAFLLEDLAFRALQVEFKAAIARQIVIGDTELDGFVAINNQPHLFEVKYFTDRTSRMGLRRTFDRLSSLIGNMRWVDAKIVICIVFDSDDSDISSLEETFNPGYQPVTAATVIYRIYRGSDLIKRFVEVSS